MQPFLAGLGRFRIERELGRGGMGVVYRAFDPVVERPVAIKTIVCSEGLDVESLERLRREAKAVGSLEHPNIVTLFDASDCEGMFYLVMQLVEGETLRDRIDRQRKFDPCEVLDIFRQLLDALEYAHARGVVHRDVKPANVMITREGIVKLTDFGVARVGGPGISSTGIIVGTPSYMSPEQLLGAKVDRRSDIFAAGCILYELALGRKPFAASTTTAVMYKVLNDGPEMPDLIEFGLPAALESVILRALAKEPADRFATCTELLSALELCLAKTPSGSKIRRSVFAPRPRISARVVRRLEALNPKAVAVGLLLTASILSAVLVAAARNERATVMMKQSETPAEPFREPIVELKRAPVPHAGPPVSQPSRLVPRRGPLIAGVPQVVSTPKVSSVPPDNFSSLVVNGDVAFQEDHYNEALEFYKRALLLKPADGSTLRRVAMTLNMLTRSETAVQGRKF